MFIQAFKFSFAVLLLTVIIISSVIGIIRFIEYIEENTYAAKNKIQKIIYISAALHILEFFNGVSYYSIAIGLIVIYCFNIVLMSYPDIPTMEPPFLLGIVGALINHFLLIKCFMENSTGVFFCIYAFIHCWIVPFCFFFSMSATDNLLFVRKDQKRIKTYAGMFKDFIMNIGKKSRRVE